MTARRTLTLIPFGVFLILLLAFGPGAGLLEASASPETEDEILLVLTGDIMPARRVAEKCEEHNDPYLPYHGIDNFTKKGDITFGNLETTVSTRGEPQEKLYHFRIQPESLVYIREAGFDVLCIANNHISDYGPNATLDTMKNIEDYGLNFTGMWYKEEEAPAARIQRPVVTEVKGVTFAFLSFAEIPFHYFRATEDKPGLVPTWSRVMKADIEYAESLADVVVVSVHWCYVPEYLESAMEIQLETCHKLAEYGADIIANHGPHVLQEIEVYNGTLIFHSLGNTVFDQPIKKTEKSAIALVHMDGTKLKTLELVPLRKNDKHQYIPQGDILVEEITPDLFLNWSDYDSRMFSSMEYITDYVGADATWKEAFFSVPVLITLIVTICILLLLILGLLFLKNTRSPGSRSSRPGSKKHT